jgi:hypothetical protein
MTALLRSLFVIGASEVRLLSGVPLFLRDEEA